MQPAVNGAAKRWAQVNSGFFYSSAEQRERLVRAERQVTTERVQKIIDLKREVSARMRCSCCLRSSFDGNELPAGDMTADACSMW